MLIDKEYLSQPQNESCLQLIRVPFMEYQTLSVDTKNLRLISRLQASLVWIDEELAWDTSVYPFDEVVLPVSKIWTPELHVTNGIITNMKHSSHDLLLSSNGTVRHTVTINAEIGCEVNMFNYPFAADSCPVAIQAWTAEGCGTELLLGDLKNVGNSHGDWQTEHAFYARIINRNDRNYIMVQLRIKYLNPFITLFLPSILIVLADAISFALPLGGGERNCFKVTLVLSFTMFLIILNNEIPGDGHCSPIIRTHFCICLVFLVFSMLVSMVLTGIATEGSILSLCCTKRSAPKRTANEEEKADEETKADISVVPLDTSEEHTRMLRKVVSFLEDLGAQQLKREGYQKIAKRIDEIFFWLYLIFGSIYFLAMTYVMVHYTCPVNHFDFWY
ncbi:5-hydroxytryptamine receptor 3B-like [Acanthopagrus latus]|uniref:5-hydroxytryptamine receptor 3B-like n=1 Tax=Acanthopagrus latus TaxID=8177 RepID=UPI00187C08DD|nr:5-hydroxytryptamine receptor 3B-like [Acanthopagrus latus]XP_036945156.1 5-hydroxytryptamine receptor 3B-like [Acanthopagrus latus]